MKTIVLLVIASILVVGSFILASNSPSLATGNPNKERIQIASVVGLEADGSNATSSTSQTQALQTKTPTANNIEQTTTTTNDLAQLSGVPTAKASAPTPVPQAQQVAASTAQVTSSTSIPILMYHYIRINPNPKDQLGFGLSITPSDFAAQMNHMAQLGYRSISLADLDDPANYDGKTFIITFDDGYADAYEVAYPILQQHGFKGVFYIITGLVGRPSFLNWDQVQDLANKGMIIGSHTVNHPNLSTLGTHELRRELADSKAALEIVTGKPVTDFCYPSGQFNADVTAAARQVGYLTAVTTKGGRYHPGDDHMILSRVRISGGMTLPEFASMVTPGQKPR